jgi:hypothetical protein
MQEDRPVSQRTRLLFALAGIVTCLAAALLAELTLGRMNAGALLRRGHAASLLFATAPETTRRTVQDAAPAPTDAEVQRRLDLAGAQSGDVQISLAWNNNNDLDLSCQEPDGEMIDGYNQSSRSGGVLDVDMNPTDDSLLTDAARIKILARESHLRAHRTSYANEYQPAPVENLVWAHNAPSGHYKVFVHQFCNKERVERTPFWIVVRVRGDVHRISGSVGREDFAEQLIDPKLVYEFDVAPAKPNAIAGPRPIRPAPAPAPPPPRVVTRTAYSLGPLSLALLSAGLWGGLLGLLPIGLLLAQRAYLKLPAVYGEDDLIVAIGGPITGFLAVMLGQLALSLAASTVRPEALPILFVTAWTLAGGLFGFVLALYTPNVPRVGGLAAGAISALAGSALFLPLAAGHLDLAGRLITAALIGAAIGALVALPERERTPERAPDPPPAPPRATFETQPPFIVRGTRTSKVGGLRQTGPPDR